tara:strand:- start:139 stop:393 length:255 start_codon:yes stop_codon:yes gene_type:complete
MPEVKIIKNLRPQPGFEGLQLKTLIEIDGQFFVISEVAYAHLEEAMCFTSDSEGSFMGTDVQVGLDTEDCINRIKEYGFYNLNL